MPYAYSDIPKQWDHDENGFLRNSIRFGRVGTMEYLGDELGPERDPSIAADDILNIMIHPDTLFDPGSIRSLEGMPVVAYEHAWAEVENMTFGDEDGSGQKFAQVGSVAGTPRQNGPYLEGDIVITNKNVMEAIKNGELAEISSAYGALYKMESGEYDNSHYDGCQREIRYNHVCLLPQNEGRAGTDVRILNDKSREARVDTVRIQLPGTSNTVTVAKEDADAVASAFANKASVKINNMEMPVADIESMIAENMTLKEGLADLQGKLDTNNAEMQALKEKLEAAMSPEVVEEAAENMMKDYDESTEMLAQNMYDDEKTMNSKESLIKIRNGLKGLCGHNLRKHVVVQIRTANKLPELTEEQLSNENIISGFYTAYKETPMRNQSSKKVVGGDLHQIQNSGKGAERTAASRLGYKKAG